jgi:predicted Zn-dependent protease
LKRSQNFAASAPKRSEDPGTTAPAKDLEFDIESPETGNAEHFFEEGFGALKQGQINAAVAHLAAASRLMPHEARYRAYYGRALAATEKTRRLAEQEIQAAVTLDPRNASYRTMLAELYFELRFHRRAQTELDRALAIEPNNASAQALSRKLASLGEGSN